MQWSAILTPPSLRLSLAKPFQDKSQRLSGTLQIPQRYSMLLCILTKANRRYQKEPQND